MTEELYSAWLKEVFAKRGAQGLFGTPTLLVVDSATSHSKSAAPRNVITEFIPKGCTPLLQPLDVSINKPFKTYVKGYWREFIDTPLEEQRLTPAGNRQRVGFGNHAHMMYSNLILYLNLRL